MSKKTVAVVGGTGLQGGSVVDALLEQGEYAVRVLTRDPESEKAKALAARGVEVARGDLNAPDTLRSAFDGAHGAFVVTNFWDPGTGNRELEQGTAAVQAAKAAGVQHFVWSTLPNCKALSNGKYEVGHFTGKAEVDPVVSGAGFAHHTFVEAPFYLTNLLGMMGPQPLGEGARGWAMPMDPAKQVIHVGDATEIGRLVAAAFAHAADVGDGQHLALAGELTSWDQMIATLNAQGHALSFQRVPAEVFDGFFPGAAELRDMMEYWEEYTYFGPDAEANIAAANRLVDAPFTSFAAWAAEHMVA